MGLLCASVAARKRREDILGLAPPPTRREELAEFLRHPRERTTRFGRSELWPRHEVLESQSASKTLEHAELGALRLLHLQSIPTTDTELRLARHLPADAATRRVLTAASERPATVHAAVQATAA